MRVLITGGSGKLGKFVVEELRKENSIKVLDLREPAQKDIEFIKADIRKLKEVEAAVKGMEAVVHLAAIPHPLSDPPERIMETNVMGTFNLLEVALHSGAKRFIFASSDSTLGFVFGEKYPSPDYIPIDEQHPLRPQDSYGLSKLIGEEICKAYTRQYGIQTICLRFCWIWFPEVYQSYSKIIKDIDSNVRKLWGFVDPRDVAQACRLSLNLKGIDHETFFITGDNTFSKEPSLELIKRYYPKAEVKSYRNGTQFEGSRSLFDTSKAKRIFVDEKNRIKEVPT